MTTPLLRSLRLPLLPAPATRDDIDLPLLEREFLFLPSLRYAELTESAIDFDAFSQTCLLPADVEANLFRQMHLALFQADAIRTRISSKSSFPRADLDELIRLSKRADQIRNTLAVIFTKLARSIASQFSSTINPIDELMSESQEVILRALTKFDPDRGFRFSTYLTHAIRRHLLRFLQRRQRDRQRTFEATDASALPETKRWTLAYEQRMDRNVRDVEQLLQELKPRDRYVVRSRFGWGREFEPRTLQEIAAELGVTRERVRQLEQRALKQLGALAVAKKIEPA